jgi:hypothetical protein
MRALIVCILLGSLQMETLFAQTIPASPITLLQPSRLFEGLSSKVNHFHQQIHTKSEQLITRLQKKEMQLYRQLRKKDSAAAQKLFADIDQRYARYRQVLHDSARVAPLMQQYQPTLDSLNVAMQYISQHPLTGMGAGNELGGQLQSLQQTRYCKDCWLTAAVNYKAYSVNWALFAVLPSTNSR